ncbi:MAG: formylglycine-generating enzyme family protein [Nitrospinae bacterium]|nr:formylglycine-generating enzyme family protein [Nitrospinota bacterium]
MKQGSQILILSMGFFLFFSSNETWANSQVLIPAGEFKMGTEKGTQAEQPVHSIWIDDFLLDRYEVANKDYEKTNPQFKRSRASACDDCPATRVSWEETKNYCQEKGMRLPTEAEWEKARRGPNNLNVEPHLKNARYGLSFEAGTAPVQSSTENGYGLHHMEGNVWEWTNDWFDENITPIRQRRIQKVRTKAFGRSFGVAVGIMISGICKPGCIFAWHLM